MIAKIYLILFLLFNSCTINSISENRKIKFNDILNYYIEITDRDNEYIGISSINNFDNSNEYLIMINIGSRKFCEIGTYKNDDVYLNDEVLIVLAKNNILNKTYFNFKNKVKIDVCLKENNNVHNNDAGRENLILKFDKNYNFLNVYSPYYNENYVDKEKTSKLLKILSR